MINQVCIKESQVKEILFIIQGHHLIYEMCLIVSECCSAVLIDKVIDDSSRRLQFTEMI